MQKNSETCDFYDEFCVFVLSHGLPDEVLTVKSLLRHGYTGAYYIVLDDEDTSIDEYKAKFGADKVVIFSKDEVAEYTDEFGKRLGHRGTPLYARNACFDLAKKLGYTYFMELDDDDYEFDLRYDEDGVLRNLAPTNLDLIFQAFLDYYKSCPQMKSLCMAQGGDFLGGVGGAGSQFHKRFLRKAMNSWICSVDRPFKFRGKFNDDVNTYCMLGSQGDLFCTVVDVSLDQLDTQCRKSDNGLSGAYIGNGTYLKSFYTVMCCPSFTKIGIMGNNHARVHHNVDWKHAVPKIISSRYKKEVDK